MAFDGITIAALTKEIKNIAQDARITKITQPENDELMLTINSSKAGTNRILLSASASLPLVYITQSNKPSPLTAPTFCMLLRKHILNGRIIDISQPDFERIIKISIEHYDEMGDLCTRHLIIELMGKHSNIIFTNDNNVIIDSIKHIPASVSSVREVLPGREYFVPKTSEKKNPLEENREDFISYLLCTSMPIYKALYSHYTGLSPFISQDICSAAAIDADSSTDTLKDDFADGTVCRNRLWEAFNCVFENVKQGLFTPCIAYENEVPFDYSAIELHSFSKDNIKCFDSISALLESYYAEKEIYTRIRQRSADLRKIVQTILERDIKKYDLQVKQLSDTDKKDKYRLYGELLNTYGYNIPQGSKNAVVLNYYTNEEITIPLDETLTPLENAQKFFDKYGKLKRTREALEKLTIEVKEEIDHLESVQTSLNIATTEDDLTAIKEEMIEAGYIRRKSSEKKPKIKSMPLHYITKEGFHIYVGKNNIQNEEITFKLANGNDWWFHAKKIPGSHVIVKTEGKELPDSVFEDAARLAAHYSKAGGQSKIEVDYVLRKEVKHPNGSKPGFVVYYTNYSMLIDPDISHLQLV